MQLATSPSVTPEATSPTLSSNARTTLNQEAPGHNPYESVWGASIKDLVVVHRSGTAPAWIQLMVMGGDLEHHTSSGSIGSPAESNNPGMLAVGAAPWYEPEAIEYFSSRGPTPDGRVKPDVVGADCGETALSTSFCGTSQAAPHVAGLAALVRQGFPGYSPAEVVAYLKDNAKQRVSSPDPNSTWGHGFAVLPSLSPGTTPVVDTEPFERNRAQDFDTLVDAGIFSIGRIWSDGVTMWVADSAEKTIYAYDLTTKQRVPGRGFETLRAADRQEHAGSATRDIWSDGVTMWVLDTAGAGRTRFTPTT